MRFFSCQKIFEVLLFHYLFEHEVLIIYYGRPFK